MNSKDYRNIREAYLDVYGNIMEKEDSEYEKASDAALDSRFGYGRATYNRNKNINASYEPDLFDVILEYLITEGYADTQEAALAIMGNMSEDWRESIIVEDIESRREMLKQQRIQQRISSTEAQKRKRFKEQDRETLKKEIIKALIQRQQSSTN